MESRTIQQEMKSYPYGPYIVSVLSNCDPNNPFSNRSNFSVWISMEGRAYAKYCFSAKLERDVLRELSDPKVMRSYINYFLCAPSMSLDPQKLASKDVYELGKPSTAIVTHSIFRDGFICSSISGQEVASVWASRMGYSMAYYYGRTNNIPGESMDIEELFPIVNQPIIIQAVRRRTGEHAMIRLSKKPVGSHRTRLLRYLQEAEAKAGQDASFCAILDAALGKYHETTCVYGEIIPGDPYDTLAF